MSFEQKNQECFSFLRKNVFLFQKILFNGCGTPCIYIPGLLQRAAYAGLCASHVANTVVCGAVLQLASQYKTPGTQPKISFVPIVRRIFMVTLMGLCLRENFWISPALSVLLYLFSCYLTPFFFSTRFLSFAHVLSAGTLSPAIMSAGSPLSLRV